MSILTRAALLAATTAAVLAGMPAVPAAAQNDMICYQVKTERGRLQQEVTKFGYDYMGTIATMGMCAASCMDQPKNDQAGCVIVACGAACAFIGMNYCVEAVSMMSGFSEREKELDRIAQANGCPRS